MFPPCQSLGLVMAMRELIEQERRAKEFIGPRCPPRVVIPANLAALPDFASLLEGQRSNGLLLPVVVDRLG